MKFFFLLSKFGSTSLGVELGYLSQLHSHVQVESVLMLFIFCFSLSFSSNAPGPTGCDVHRPDLLLLDGKLPTFSLLRGGGGGGAVATPHSPCLVS